jgi:hypothetical protein
MLGFHHVAVHPATNVRCGNAHAGQQGGGFARNGPRIFSRLSFSGRFLIGAKKALSSATRFPTAARRSAGGFASMAWNAASRRAASGAKPLMRPGRPAGGFPRPGDRGVDAQREGEQAGELMAPKDREHDDQTAMWA